MCSGSVLADKIERYLSQHPYIKQLSLNIFNPGSGTIISEALAALQRKKEYTDLRYDVRLFALDPESPALGEALESLVKPSASVQEVVDAFCLSTGNHLFSKMNLAKHSLRDFHNNPQKYASHISLLLDVFPTEELSTTEKPPGHLPLYGLIQDYDSEFIDDDSGTYWKKSPVIGGSVQSGVAGAPDVGTGGPPDTDNAANTAQDSDRPAKKV